MKRYVIAAAVLASGCTSIEPLRPDMAARSMPSRLDEIAYINSLREAFEFTQTPSTGCYAGSELRYFRPKYTQGYPDHNSEQEQGIVGMCVKYKTLVPAEREEAIARYLDAGYGLTDLYCQRYFVIAAETAQARRFQRNSGSTVDTLMNAVLGVANAGQTALAVANAGFEAYDSTYQNIEDAFMVAPELENVRKLVHAAQLDYRSSTAKKPLPQSYESARSVIERYAGLCSYSGMKQLVNDSVSSETRDLLDSAERGGTGAKTNAGTNRTEGTNTTEGANTNTGTGARDVETRPEAAAVPATPRG